MLLITRTGPEVAGHADGGVDGGASRGGSETLPSPGGVPRLWQGGEDKRGEVQ